MRASSNSHGSRTSSSTGCSPSSSLLFSPLAVMFSWSEVSIDLELVVDDDATRRGGVELLDNGQMRGMLHVLLKPGGVLETGEEGVGVPSGAPREVFSHGEVHGARHLVSQSADRRDEILDHFRRSIFPNGEKHEMIHQSYVPLLPAVSDGV